MTSLLTIGTFDLLHVGHLSLLRKCRQLADHVTVAVNPDDFVAEFKGAKPVIPQIERMEMLRECRLVDAVMPASGRNSSTTIDIWTRGNDGPRVLAIGLDWRDRDYMAQLGIDEDFLKFRCIELVYLDSESAQRSSAIKAKLHGNLLGQ